MVDLTVLLDDLRAEGDELDALVAELPEADWALPTPAEGWTIAHQVAHLLWTDDRALLSVTDPEGFYAEAARMLAASISTWVDDGAAEGARVPPAELLDRWRKGRSTLAAAIAALPEGTRVPWYGPAPMKPASLVTARLMETWAHTTDVADSLRVRREPTPRLRHVAHLGVITRDFAFGVRGLAPPAEPFRIELTAPDGALWTWGLEDAAQRVTGSAMDFCFLATQRIHRSDTDLVAIGEDANRWLDIAQAFAGPSGDGRKPGSRP